MPKESVIKHYSSSTTGSVPLAADLVEGELAINTADEKVFFKNLGGTVVDLASSKAISGAYSPKGHTHGVSDITDITTVGGNFAKLANPSAITYPIINADNTVSALTGPSFRRSIGLVIPVTVTTAAATAAKVGTTEFGDDVPAVGDVFAVTFTLGNSVSTPTLTIDGTTVRNIRLNNANANTSTFSLNAGATVLMYFDGTFYQVVGSQDTSDDYDIYSLRTYSTQVGAEVTQYKWLMESTDGKFYPISIGNTTATTKTVSTVEFKINSNVLYYYTTATLAADAISTVFYSEGLAETRYGFNQSTWTLYQPVYLVGSVNSNGNFVLDNSTSTSYFTQTLPTTEDGKLYIYVGIPYANTAMKLFQYHPIYEYKNGRIRQYVPNLQGDDITSGTIANARTTATASNVADTIVARDASGNFSAGTITATLSGTASSATTATNSTQLGGTAANLWALLSSIGNGTLTLNVSGTGLTSGIQTFTANQSGNTTFTVTSNATSANTAGAIVSRDSNGDFTGRYIFAQYFNHSHGAAYRGADTQFYSSTDDYIRKNTKAGFLASLGLTNTASTNTAGTIVLRDGSGNFSAGTITATLSGSATSVSNALTIGTGLAGTSSTYNGSAAVTIANTGVLSLNGLTGARTLTGDGGAIVGVGNDTIRARLATTTATGAASFSSTNFDVSAGGAVSVKTGGISNTNLVSSTISGVSLGSNLNALTIGTGLGGSSYNGQTAATITNTGVLSFNSQTGAVTYSPAIASTSATGVASFNSTYFSVSSGAVSLASAYQATGDTVITVPGSGIAISTSGKTDTLFNIGVTSINGATGAVSNVAFTNVAQTFTALQTFSVGISGQGATFSGHLSAATKSFVIPHPTVKGMELHHGSLEGPENGVYVRGHAHGRTVDLPHYWTGLVDESTITVQVTPFGRSQNLYVESVSIHQVVIGGDENPSYFYTIYGERKDVPKLKVEV